MASASVRIAGNKFDGSIQDFIRRKYGLAIGDRTAEQVKIEIGSALYLEKQLTMEVKGRDIVSGLPKIVTVTSSDVTDAVQASLEGMIVAIKDVLNQTPPELAADIMDKGMVLSGGSSQLRNLTQLFSQATGVPAYMADEPLFCVARGTGIALENLESYKRSILSTK